MVKAFFHLTLLIIILFFYALRTVETSHSNSAFMEYVILIEFSPKLQIYQPD